MNVDRWLRLLAGFFVVLSLATGYFVHPYWYFFTAFANWCPMMSFLRKLGVKDQPAHV